MSLEEDLDSAWTRIRKLFLFPNLPAPELVPQAPYPALIDMESQRIIVSRHFVKKMTRSGRITPEETMAALLAHETAHHTKCPYDFLTFLQLYAASREVMKDQESAMLGLNYYLDVVVDSHVTLEKNMTELASLCSAEYAEGAAKVPAPTEEATRKLMDVAFGLYQELWQADLGVTPDVEALEYIAKLKDIDYLRSADRARDVKQFLNVLGPLLEQAQQEQKRGKKGKKGKKGKGSSGDPQAGDDGQPMPNNLDPSSFSENDIRDALKEFAKGKDPEEVERLIEELKLDERLGKKKLSMGFSLGNPTVARTMVYGSLARNYSVPVKKRQLHRDGSLYPYTLTKYQLGDDLQRLDPFNSQGKVIPGLSQRWVYKESETVGRSEGVPDAIICLDSSQSMVDPGSRMSYAVLGAVCAADAYLDNGASVAVLNFSSTPKVTTFTKSRDQLLEALCTYQSGGTELAVHELEKLIAEAKDKVDIVLISDLAIQNFEHVLKSIAQHHKTHRFTVVSLAPSEAYVTEMQFQRENVNQLRKRFEGTIGFYRVENERDIPDIILGETTKSFS